EKKGRGESALKVGVWGCRGEWAEGEGKDVGVWDDEGEGGRRTAGSEMELRGWVVVGVEGWEGLREEGRERMEL
ncbi:hypothetical protein, partial [Kocuria marina]|uniref:hypothetical protein n=1 Tax=Kocuria marina TaxID=223184 RepID=UPI001C92EA1E